MILFKMMSHANCINCNWIWWFMPMLNIPLIWVIILYCFLLCSWFYIKSSIHLLIWSFIRFWIYEWMVVKSRILSNLNFQITLLINNYSLIKRTITILMSAVLPIWLMIFTVFHNRYMFRELTIVQLEASIWFYLQRLKFSSYHRQSNIFWLIMRWH